MIILDSDIIIWYLHKSQKAKQFIKPLKSFCVSAVTYMEIMQGMRNKQELAEFLAVFNSWPVNIINIKESVCEHAMMLVEEYTLSHSMQFGDALIAATAIDRGMTLATANVKHYKFVSNLRLETFKP